MPTIRGMCTCIHMNVEVREHSGLSSQQLSTLFVSQVSHCPRAHQESQTGWQASPKGLILFPLPVMGTTGVGHCAQVWATMPR